MRDGRIGRSRSVAPIFSSASVGTLGGQTLDTGERLQHRLDVVLLQFTAVVQQNQLRRRRFAALHLRGQVEQRLAGHRDAAQGRLQFAARALDAKPNFLLILGLQQRPLADVLEVDADKVAVFGGRADSPGALLGSSPASSKRRGISCSSNASGSSSSRSCSGGSTTAGSRRLSATVRQGSARIPRRGRANPAHAYFVQVPASRSGASSSSMPFASFGCKPVALPNR